jgi:iron complex transport system ATP-binding protein
MQRADESGKAAESTAAAGGPPAKPAGIKAGDFAILSLRGVSFRYPRAAAPALDGVNIDLAAETSTAVLGPNGAGKSTLLDICLSWRQPQKGEICLAGRPMEQYRRRELGSWMSLVPQDERVRFSYSATEYLLLGRTPYLRQLELPGEEDLEIVAHALETVGLPHLSRRSVSTLSGGEHQLLLIARALVQQPRILILDEPTSRLDPAKRRRIIDLLLHLREGGKTLLLTTHDPGLAAELASHTILLKKGRVAASGDTDDILNSERLSGLYDTPMRVLRMGGRIVVV